MRAGRDSAARTLSRGQVIAGIAFLLVSAALFRYALMAYLLGLAAALTVGYAVMMAFKALLTLNALRRGPLKVSRQELDAIGDWRPLYTVMVPLYREAEVVGSLLASLRQLDYPPQQLQILLLCEADDAETMEALSAANPGPPFEVVLVEPSYPRTKPKVCNIGLERARGRYLVIYDAEDRPEPDQLKKAVIAFRKLSRSVICLQAKLEYRNPRTNLLTRFFAAEYGTFFDMLLPSLARHGLPVPLGGTSNHFRTAALRDLGGWDAYNVTEDLDLGMWIARRRWRVEILDSVTWEEANSRVGNWVRQRSRWLKGYMQTYLVHMRSPLRLWRELGTGNFLAFQLLVGGTPLVALVNPLLWALTAAYVVTGSSLISDLFPAPVFYTGIVSMVAGNFVFMYYLVTGCMLLGHSRNAKWMLLAPLYWLLMSVAAWKAAIQLLVRPHYWEKTRHGLVAEEFDRVEETSGDWRPRVLDGELHRHGDAVGHPAAVAHQGRRASSGGSR
jgi:cellulose synthase/poly-beta-1,6-N-acetylglucosamine synthase-like glycosyltransferase